MVLELIINPKKIKNKSDIIIVGFVYAVIASFLASWIFKSYTSIVMITLTIIASIPFVSGVIKKDEESDLKIKEERKLIKEHGKTISLLLLLFSGFVLAFTMLYVFMPVNIVENLFKAQLNTISAVESSNIVGNHIYYFNGSFFNVEGTPSAVTGNFIYYKEGYYVDNDDNLKLLTGNFFMVDKEYENENVSYTSVTGHYASPFKALTAILLNNLKILLICLAFSFFYGAGSIFILTWNASVMAAAIGAYIRTNTFFVENAFGYLQITTLGLLRYFIHGIPEIAAYFIGALASGIISFAVMNHDFRGENMKRILKDVAILFAIALAVLLIAGLLEVFVTPLIPS